MKKILFALMIVAMATTSAFAQFGFGVHAAANMSTLYGDDAGDAASGIGFSAGVAAKLALPFVAVVPEVLIDMRNMVQENDIIDDITYTEWALEIPVMVRLSVLPILFVEAGPTFAFNLSVSAEDEHDNEVKFNDDYFNSFEFGLAFGLGTGIIPFLDIDFRVNMGITNWIAEQKDELTGKDLEINASNLQFALGATYWF